MRKLFNPLLLIISATLLLSSCKDEPQEDLKPLSVPENIQFTVTHNSATVTWDAVEGAQGYIAELKNSGGAITEEEVSAATVTFSELEGGARYSFRVKAICIDILLDSAFSAWTDLTTSETPVLAVPANVVVSDIAASSATVSWGAVQDAVEYKLEYRKTGEAPQELISPTTTASLDGLDAETAYEVRVMAAGNEAIADSEFSEWVGFTSGEGTVAGSFKGGSGTQADPYLIATPGQLALLAQRVNDEEEGYVDAYYKLDADINLEGRAWIPIGRGTGNDLFNQDPTQAFMGHFDGAGHTISNLNCVVTENADPCIAGLFGINQGQIRNLTVTGYSESNSTYTGTQGYTIAGGIAGVNSITSDLKNGKIEDCKFSGSIKATSTVDYTTITAAGGVCGVVASGNVDRCEVTVDTDDKIEAIGGTADAGGLTGWFDAGGTKDNKVVIKGAVRAIIMDEATLGDLTANVGGLISGCRSNMGYFNDCEVDITSTGSLLAESRTSAGASNAGGILATSAANMSGMKVNVAGKIEGISRDGGRVAYVGGILGRGMGAIVGNCQTTITGSLRAVSDSDAGAAYLGGIMGDATGTFSWNTVALDGSYYAEAKNSVFCGGVAGGAGATGGCYFIMGSSATIEMKSGAQYFGGITGNGRMANHHGCYAIIGGNVKANTSGNVIMGGISSSVGGSISSQRRNITGSYTIIDGTFTTEGDPANTSIGGIVGSTTAYGTLNSDWWWCGNTTVTQGHGANAEASGVTKFAGKDKASLEAALESINTALLSVGFGGRFIYDDAKQRLVITQD